MKVRCIPKETCLVTVTGQNKMLTFPMLMKKNVCSDSISSLKLSKGKICKIFMFLLLSKERWTAFKMLLPKGQHEGTVIDLTNSNVAILCNLNVENELSPYTINKRGDEIKPSNQMTQPRGREIVLVWDLGSCDSLEISGRAGSVLCAFLGKWLNSWRLMIFLILFD